MPDTIRSTARNAGYLDIKMIPERRNKVKLLLLFDGHHVALHSCSSVVSITVRIDITLTPSRSARRRTS